MMKYFIFLYLFLSFSCFGQHEPFAGKLVYTIEPKDTSLLKYYPTQYMVVYTNDTITRIENDSKYLGKQILLKHTLLNKSILIINFENVTYAIQTDLNKHPEKKDTTLVFKKKFGTMKWLGHKAKRATITNSKTKQEETVIYLKKVAPKYIDAYQFLPGLPAYFTLETEETVFVYTLRSIEKTNVNNDLFGVPSTAKKVTFDELLKIILPGQ